ncbi:Uncharacterised protein [Eikenella corrodens]|uniref:Uncharacterized protein n=2 Tax=Eikenella corrodens TaxID=539 RepID=C0DS49_EIKCO|nr:hypothetical protein [Eikenella corrodens]EEG25167.1 hypothetical protein EIKCOROL_00166 [Eikenella corrodens ATCC 23834]UAK74320.1 hypothetical protein K8P00_07215 [Eikenella corrodens]SNW10173.1 Uncharacterised protein [Eikenella corrodens]
MAKIQYSKKLRRLKMRLQRLNQRIAEAYKAAPDEIISTPFDCAASAANPALPTLPQSPAAPLPDPGCTASVQASVPPQPAPQSDLECQLYRRCIQLKSYAAKQQLAVLERRVLSLHGSIVMMLRGASSQARRKIVSDSFLRSSYFDNWLAKQEELITDLDQLLKGMTDDA